MSEWQTRLSHLEGLSDDDKLYVEGKLLALGDDGKAARFFKDNEIDKDTVRRLRSLLAEAGAQPTGPGNSAEICEQAIKPPLPELPDIGQLQSVLFSDLAVKLPMEPSVMASLTSNVSRHFQPAFGSLSVTLSKIILDTPELGGEPFTAIAVHNNVIAVLIKLDRLLPPASRIGLKVQRDEADSDSLMTLKSAKGDSLRPDGQLRHSDQLRLLSKWEEKGSAHPLKDAVQDLQKKTAVWSPLYYGNLSYLVCFAAAGAHFQFYVIQRGCSTPINIGPAFNITLADDRAWLTLAAVNLYRLLAAISASLPCYLLPAGMDLVLNHPQGYQRILYILMAPLQIVCMAHTHACLCFPLCSFAVDAVLFILSSPLRYFRTDRLSVKKRVTPWSKYREIWGVKFKTLQRVYERTAMSSGLVHVASDGEGLSVERDKYTVELTPVGLQLADARPTTEQQAASSAHGFLHGLDAIHMSKHVHRDLRWENGACDLTKTRYFLLDLELCAKINKKPSFNLQSWDSDTLVDGRYTVASDLHSLGRMLCELQAIIVSEEGRSFLAELCRPAQEQQKSAEQLMSHAWIKCQGVHCRAAGAHPDDV